MSSHTACILPSTRTTSISSAYYGHHYYQCRRSCRPFQVGSLTLRSALFELRYHNFNSVSCPNKPVAKWFDTLALSQGLFFAILLPALTFDFIVRSMLAAPTTNRLTDPLSKSPSPRGRNPPTVQGQAPDPQGNTRPQHLMSPLHWTYVLVLLAVAIWAGGRTREFRGDLAHDTPGVAVPYYDLIDPNIATLAHRLLAA